LQKWAATHRFAKGFQNPVPTHRQVGDGNHEQAVLPENNEVGTRAIVPSSLMIADHPA
jgi:hypothetical protein